MGKKVLLIFLFVLILSMFFVTAQNKTDVDKEAYDCLEDKVQGNCDSLSFEEQIFSLLAIGECKDEVLDDSNYMSDTKLTAQAIWALDNAGINTDDADEWLLSQNMTPDDMDWLLQIESTDATTCSITYGGAIYSGINIGEDKRITGLVGSCLNFYNNNLWLRITPTCYNEEFQVSCQNSFLTTLLYKKTDSNTLYVSSDTHSASSGGTTTEKVSSSCFTQGSSCNYEASLWAAMVMDLKGYDVSSYLPYLITMADETENIKYLPEAFLYSLTNNFRNELLTKQIGDQWWLVSGDKYYDTALALLPFQGETITQKTNTINWLSEVQKDDGCWDTNTRNIAFILYSLWPRRVSLGDVGDDCEDSGHYCMSRLSCSDSGGEVLESFDCFGTSVCCSREKVLDTCSEQGGEICDSDEKCSVSTVEALDTDECCVGSCRPPTEKTECQLYGDGNCRTSCYSNEEESEYNCPSGSICCVEKTAKASYWWIWVLIVLIILTILGIIFRKNLRIYLTKIKERLGKFKFGGAKPGPKPRFPPGGPGGIPQRSVPRRILPPSQGRPVQRPPQRSKTEIDDVLKKLKEMGK